MDGLTFAQIDKLAAERAAKKRELVERLSTLLAREFSFQELRLIQYGEGQPISSLLIESFEIARQNAKAR
jgi:hypothetical protein